MTSQDVVWGAMSLPISEWIFPMMPWVFSLKRAHQGLTQNLGPGLGDQWKMSSSETLCHTGRQGWGTVKPLGRAAVILKLLSRALVPLQILPQSVKWGRGGGGSWERED